MCYREHADAYDKKHFGNTVIIYVYTKRGVKQDIKEFISGSND